MEFLTDNGLPHTLNEAGVTQHLIHCLIEDLKEFCVEDAAAREGYRKPKSMDDRY